MKDETLWRKFSFSETVAVKTQRDMSFQNDHVKMGKEIIFRWVSVKDRERSKKSSKYHEKVPTLQHFFWVAMERILETWELLKCKCEAILQLISGSKNLD